LVVYCLRGGGFNNMWADRTANRIPFLRESVSESVVGPQFLDPEVAT
jgi:hypothetical protein